MSINKRNPIGVFDSGLGGLTVVKELIRQLPNEDIVYFGDTARVPYGTKSKNSIIQFSRENTKVLLENKVKIVVVACNSSSSYALASLRKEFDIPIMGVIDPGAKKAVEVTKNNKVGVIATSATVHSRSYDKAIKKQNKKVTIVSQPCPLFVPLVESGWFKKKASHLIAEEYLSKIKQKKIDTLILGCTHYPLLKTILKKVMSKNVYLVDSAKEVASEVKKALALKGLNQKKTRVGKHKIIISDEPQEFQRIAKTFLNKKRQSFSWGEKTVRGTTQIYSSFVNGFQPAQLTLFSLQLQGEFHCADLWVLTASHSL